MSRQIRLKGFTVKDGKIKRDPQRLNVSLRLKQKSSKRVRAWKKFGNSP